MLDPVGAVDYGAVGESLEAEVPLRAADRDVAMLLSPLLDLPDAFVEGERASPAQIFLAWML